MGGILFPKLDSVSDGVFSPGAGFVMEKALGIFHSGSSSPLPPFRELIHRSPHDNLLDFPKKSREVQEPPKTLAL